MQYRPIVYAWPDRIRGDDARSSRARAKRHAMSALRPDDADDPEARASAERAPAARSRRTPRGVRKSRRAESLGTSYKPFKRLRAEHFSHARRKTQMGQDVWLVSCRFENGTAERVTQHSLHRAA
jgi:hypothetical protein